MTLNFPFIRERMQQAALAAGRAIMDIYAHPEADWQVEAKADNSPLTLADRRAHEVIVEMLAGTGLPVLSEEGAKHSFEVRREWEAFFIVDPLDGTKEFIKRNGEFTVNIALVVNRQLAAGEVYAPAKGVLYSGFSGADGAVACRSQVDDDHERILRREPMPVPAALEARGEGIRVVASRSHLNAATEAYVDRLRKEHGEVTLVEAGSSLKICLVAEGSADVYPRLAPTMEWDTAAAHAVLAAAGGRMVEAQTGEELRYNKEDLHNPDFVARRAE